MTISIDKWKAHASTCKSTHTYITEKRILKHLKTYNILICINFLYFCYLIQQIQLWILALTLQQYVHVEVGNSISECLSYMCTCYISGVGITSPLSLHIGLQSMPEHFFCSCTSSYTAPRGSAWVYSVFSLCMSNSLVVARSNVLKTYTALQKIAY